MKIGDKHRFNPDRDAPGHGWAHGIRCPYCGRDYYFESKDDMIDFVKECYKKGLTVERLDHTIYTDKGIINFRCPFEHDCRR